MDTNENAFVFIRAHSWHIYLWQLKQKPYQPNCSGCHDDQCQNPQEI